MKCSSDKQFTQSRLSRTKRPTQFSAHLFLVALFLLRSLLLGGLLLLLLVGLLLSCVPRQGLFEDLEDFLISDLLIRLVLANVKRLRSAELSDAVLGDGLIFLLAPELRPLSPLSSSFVWATYRWWLGDGQQGCCPCRRRARTDGRRCHERTQRHRTWRHAHLQAA